MTIRPRSPKWNLAVGSFWFDVATGQLVRAAYRLAVPIDVWARSDERQREEGTSTNPIMAKIAKAHHVADTRRDLRASRSSMDCSTASTGCRERDRSRDRSRSRSRDVPVEIEQAFSYDKINAPGTITAIALNAPDLTPLRVPDSLYGKDAPTLARLGDRGATEGTTVIRRLAAQGAVRLHGPTPRRRACAESSPWPSRIRATSTSS